MAFHCQPCIDVMTKPGWSMVESIGPCECCLKQSRCLEIKNYQWSEKNTEINKAARAAVKQKEPEKQTQYEKAVVAEEVTGRARGGKARMASMTDEERSDLARKGAETRWSPEGRAEAEKKKSGRQPRRGMDCYAFQVQDAITGETLGYFGFKSNGEVMLLTPMMVRQKQVVTDEVPDEVANFFQHAVARLEEEREVDRLNSIAKY